MLKVQWVKSTKGTWLPFETFDVSKVTDEGVYLIWHAGQPPRPVKVGQGDIADRVAKHRADPKITKYRSNGTLLITWARVSAANRAGVERYLGDRYKPLVGDRFPNVVPVHVNLPGKAA